MGKSKNDKEFIEMRNFVARDMANKFKSKRFSNDRGNRRQKEKERNWFQNYNSDY